MDAPTVVFILSTNYAGSHLLAALLAAHRRCAGVGELHNYHKFRERGSRSGNVVDDYLVHPAFAGLDRLPVAAWHGTIWRRLRAERPELTHLIDNSKRPEWAQQFRAADARAVHLLRDPRALVSRWLRTYDSADARRRQRRRVLLRRPAAWRSDDVELFVEKWLMANRAISRFTSRRARTSLVTYHDLARHPEPTLRRLMPELDLPFEPGQLAYGEAPGQLGTRKRDYRDAADRSAIEIDVRWREQLDATDQRRIAEHPGVRRYLAQLGLTMTDAGLSRLT